MESLKLTAPIARKILAVVDAGLVNGKGVPEPGKMCVEAAVCFAFGLPHGDDPPCVGSSVRSFKIRLNDFNWSSKAARAKGMRKIAVAQVGSDQIDQAKFRRLLQIGTIKKILPIALRATAQTNQKYAVELERFAAQCETTGTKESAIEARDFCYKICRGGGVAYAADAAAADAYAAAAYAAATEKYSPGKRDEILTISADIALDVLKELKSPGCEFLYLCDEA